LDDKVVEGQGNRRSLLRRVLIVPAVALVGLTGLAIGEKLSIQGGGAVNYIPKFTTAAALGNSALVDNGNSIAVPNNYPIYFVDNVGGTGAGLTLDNSNNMYLAYPKNYALKIRDGMTQAPTSFQAEFVSTALNYGYTFENQGNIYIYGGTIVTSSDERLKENIQQIDNALDKVLRLTGVYFNWKDKSLGSNRQIGFVAQDVQPIIPELVVPTGKDGTLAVDYMRLVPVLLEAVKEQNMKITELEQRILRLEKA
jgi:hypothetical protein